MPFSDDEFRRRRAHPNFREHHSAEKIITKLGLTVSRFFPPIDRSTEKNEFCFQDRKKLLTYVVATGLTYGMEENVFHYLFKSAWHNAPEVPVYGKGANFLPTIHIIDLAA